MIDHVSDTAFWVAAFRARESRRPDALFRDPYAELLAGDRGAKISDAVKGSKYVEHSVVIRTRIIDELILDAITHRGITTVVNLGTGLDARPLRLDLPPSLRWIEVDFAPVIEYKSRKLSHVKPSCELQRVALDLADQEKRRAFIDSLSREPGGKASKILVLTEGVVPYLSIPQVAELADDLAAQSAVRFWIVDYLSREVMRYMKRGQIRRELKNAPFRFDPPDWHRFYAWHGWRPFITRYIGEESRRWNRAQPLPLIGRFFMRFAPERVHAKLGKMTGYVLMERRPKPGLTTFR